ncbi:MAG TPA: D-erythronate dehydrogenase [Vicinamibacterales bacterium]|nr:D-erythronate dehydrogenase [Vicinamibacterales bacterium]
MKVVITGAAGFLGRRLADSLLRRGALAGPGDREQPIERITLIDASPPAPFDDPRVSAVTGDISDPALFERSIDRETRAIFHLAAIVSGTAEADFELGMRVNLDASRALLDVCRRLGQVPRLVFTSSVAVFGGDLPAVVTDATAVEPATSYGTQKAIVDLLINDYSRRGFIDGRALRLPTISVRPGRPNTALSSFASGIIREPLNGEEAICPVDPGTRVWLLSPRKVIECLMMAHDLPAQAFGSSRVLSLPGLSVTVAEMVEALGRIAGPDAVRRIRWERDPHVARVVATWPGALDAARARALGFPADQSFDDVIRQFLEERLATPA